jgi:hypothetical protein
MNYACAIFGLIYSEAGEEVHQKERKGKVTFPFKALKRIFSNSAIDPIVNDANIFLIPGSNQFNLFPA